MSRWRSSLYAIVFMWVAMALWTSRVEATPYEIAFKGSPFVPPAEEFSLPSDAPGVFDGRVHVLVQLWEHLEQGDRSRFMRRGVALLHYFPDRAYVVSIPIEFDEAVLQSLGARWAGVLPTDSKIHPRIRRGDFSDWSRYGSDARVFSLNIVKDVALSRARIYLANCGFDVGDELRSTHVLFVAAQHAQVEQLAAYDFVLFIAEAPPPLTETNDVARQRVHADECQALPYDLRGRGVTALVFDCALVDRTHHDFSINRIVLGEPGVPYWHPTHVAGTLGGNGANSGGLYRGMAPEVRMLSMHYAACIPHCLYDSPQDIEDDYETAIFSYGADVANNSISSNVASNGYSCEWEGDYETTSQLLDAIVRGSLGQSFVVVFAAGNERTAGIPSGRCGDSYGTMGVPAGAKNIITVGASDDSDGMAAFSSWGPTDDGRIKPELCAPGVNITSTSMDNTYYSISGTSMATPVVSGSIALLLEQWHRMLPDAPAPLPETVKALLIASANDVGSPGPDFEFGYGILDIQKAIDFLLHLGFIEGELAVGETFVQEFDVPDTVAELNIALAWSDVPGEYNVTTALVNQLDFWLLSPSLQTYRPWILAPEFPYLSAGTGIDSMNVVECVHVDAPEPGVWILCVSGILPGSQTQTFGVAGNVALNPDMTWISGTVRDSQSGEPLAARVEIAESESFVNAHDNGVYCLPVLRNSAYAVRAWIYGCAPDTKVVVVGDMPEVLQDFTLSTAALGTFEGYVFNTNRGPVAGAAISLTKTPLLPVRTNSAGFFHLSAPGGTAYQIVADYEGCREDMTIFLPESQVASVEFHLFDCRFDPTPPDAYGYLAYEQNDIEAPAVFDWLEISPTSGGPGEAIEFSDGNSLAVISLPFVFRYYGQDFEEATLSADGYLAMGVTDEADYTQSPIPDPDGPAAMLAPFWDNMDVTAGGDVSAYYDALKGRFIIEFNDVPQQRQLDSLVTFQLILHDPLERSTPSCDGEIVFQYALFQYYYDERHDGGTVGIESPDELTGVQIVYDAVYDFSSFPIRSGTAIRFTTSAWEAFGGVSGTIEMIPPVADIPEVDIMFGCHRVHPDSAGHFEVDFVAVGTYRMRASYPGYEVGVQEITIDSVLQSIAAFELWRLDPPYDLEGSTEDSLITLRWSPPHFRIPQTASPKGGATITSLSNYKVYRNGELRDSVADTTFVETASPGEYEYWIVAIYTGGESDTSNHAHVEVVSSGGQTDIGVPNEFCIHQNYPNPFNAVTRIEFGLPHRAFVELDVFDILGRKIAVLTRDYREAGYYSILFDAGGLPSGIYFCRMRSAEFHGVQKMLLIK